MNDAPPRALSQEQVDDFWRDGFACVPDAVSPAQLVLLQEELAGWVAESRNHGEPFGTPTVDGRPRFDMGAEHSAENPALRRINNPSEISKSYYEVMSNAAMVDMVSDLIGPDLKFHHCKMNVKLPGSETRVRYHQDFAYTPHTNDDVVTALLMLEEVTEENGCLMAVPGSHRGSIDSLYDGETFSGMVAPVLEADYLSRQVAITGQAGSVCLMHTRLKHGSEPNMGGVPRPMYICVYSAADAVAIARNPMPSPQEGMIVRGRESRTARMMDLNVELPKQPKSASFFTVQGQKSATGD